MAARLPYLQREQVPTDVQTVYDDVQKATGRVPNMFKLMAHHAKSLPPFLGWYPTLREGALDIKLRQLAYVKASQLNGCHYCCAPPREIPECAMIGQRCRPPGRDGQHPCLGVPCSSHRDGAVVGGGSAIKRDIASCW